MNRGGSSDWRPTSAVMDSLLTGHDTYAIGCTLAGLHRFNYRKCARHSLPGDTFVLHPDELHDGEAGNEAGFRYRIVYIEPALLQGPLGGQPLPFIDDGVSRRSAPAASHR